MSNRLYRVLFGVLLLIALYFDFHLMTYALIGMAAIEAISNLRIPQIASQLRRIDPPDPSEGSLGIGFHVRTAFEAERGWRLTVATVLVVSVFIFPEPLWFIPWFMGFTILGAGISGVCPGLLGLKWLGLR